MKLSREWLSDYVDLSNVSDEQLSRRFTEIGHAVDSVESHAGDTVFDLEITTNRVDAMSHRGMARELAAADASSSYVGRALEALRAGHVVRRPGLSGPARQADLTTFAKAMVVRPTGPTMKR